MEEKSEAQRALDGVDDRRRVLPFRGPRATLKSEASGDLGLVGQSAAIAEVRERILRYAPLPYPVLILGETGTGKELVAKALHARSRPAARPFVVANAAAFTEALMGSELFGHERGAFTGAVARHRGLFEMAHGGTLFLDEVAEMSVGVQASLLRAIEQGEVRPLGAERERKVDVRVIAATNADLTRMLAAGRLRHDLYRRLSVLRMVLPPLRERREDIPLLARHLLARHANPGAPLGLTDLALKMLSFERWPGNVRELESIMVRAATLAAGPLIDGEDVNTALGDDGSHTSAEASPATPEIRSAFAQARGNVSGAARLLGVPRTTLRDRLRRHRGP